MEHGTERLYEKETNFLGRHSRLDKLI